MKKLILIALVMALVFSFAACSSKNSSSSMPSNKQQSGSAGGTYNPKDHFTAVAVDIAFVKDWMLPTDGVITEVELEDKGLGIYRIRVEGIAKSQCETYKKILETNGMTEGFDKFSNREVIIDFTNTFLTDKAEGSVLTLRIYER